MFLVLGNVAIDEAMAAPMPPTPGATVLVGPPRRDLGGKGANQAIVLRRAWHDVRFVATIGDDPAARWIVEMLDAESIDTSHLITVAGPSDRSLIFVGPGGDNAIASTSHCSDALTPAHATAALNAARAGDVLVLQGGTTVETNRAAIAAARARGLRVAFNPSAVRPGFETLLDGLDLVVVNAGEATELVGAGPPDAQAQRLAARGIGAAVVTLGADGAVSAGSGGQCRVPAAPASVRDTTGAGDTYFAVLAAALFAGNDPMPVALRKAAAAAAITVSRAGTRAAFPTGGELAEILG